MLSVGRSWWEFSLLLILFAFISPVSSVCYYPDGDVTPNDVPCSDSTTESVCCSLGYVCLSNGICMKSDNPLAASSSSTYVRGSCTDQTWRSSYCPNFCVNPNAPYQDDTAGGEGMTKCPDTTIDMYYCVDFDTSAVNCTTQQNVIKFEGTPSNLTTIGIAASTSSSPTSSSSTSSSSASSSRFTTTVASSTTISAPSSTTSIPTPTSTNKSSSAKSVAIGAGVGVPVGVIVLGLLGFLFVRYERRKRRQPDHADPVAAAQPPYKDYYGSPTTGPSELVGHEGPIPQMRHEMPGE